MQDFEDAESEGENDHLHDFLRDDDSGPAPVVNGSRRRKAQYTDHDGGMELDDDEEPPEDEDHVMADGAEGTTLGLEDGDDEEEAKAKVEKMQLGTVDDVRTVAGLMKTLQPVLEVS